MTVLGLARSGVAAALSLQNSGARVFGSDAGTPAREKLAELEAAAIPYEIGGHTGRMYEADLFVVSPGVPLFAPAVRGAVERGIEVIGEVELAYRLTEADIVAVTGSNGKSTTTTLLGELFKRAPMKSRVGGNIGVALTSQCDALKKGEVLVAEVSSFQLDAAVRFTPRVAIILNLTPDHMNHYRNIEDYYNSKLSIAKNQGPTDRLVLNADDPELNRRVDRINGAVCKVWFSTERCLEAGAFVEAGRIVYREAGMTTALLPASETGLLGRHNLSNILSAVAVAMFYAIPVSDIIEVVRTFKGIEHRLEWVADKAGVRYYNDSKATNVDSLKVALESFDQPVHLIAGGQDKAGDFASLAGLVRKRVKTVYAIGEAGDKIERAWRDDANVVRLENLDQAVKIAAERAMSGEVVLLSPACASFDQYRNFEERGKHFKTLVETL